MAVVINQFEASVEGGAPPSGAEAPSARATEKPHEFRRSLRRAAMRALRVRPS